MRTFRQYDCQALLVAAPYINQKGVDNMTAYQNHLVASLGMASTRARSLDEAMDALHSSIGAMDAWHLKTMWQRMPSLMEVVAQYADQNPGLNDYRSSRG